MQYDLTFDSFLEIPFTSGTIQNISDFALVEISTTEDAESGLILYPWEKYQWNELTIYARSAPPYGYRSCPFNLLCSGKRPGLSVPLRGD